MSKADPFKRHRTRHRGITYRKLRDGSRTYYVYAHGSQHKVSGGEAEAVALQANLRTKIARGQSVRVSKTKLDALAKEWLASKTKLRESTRRDYKADLENEILPRLGHLKPSEITADMLAKLIHDLDAKGLSGARIKNILKPLSGTLKLGLRRELLTVNPLDLLTTDERPHVAMREHHVWSPDEIKSLLTCSAALAKTKHAKYDYTPVLTVAVYAGLRISELLALRWQDIDLKSSTLRVRHQLSRTGGTLLPPKTPQALRRVPLAPRLISMLKRQKLASEYSQPADFVFASLRGTSLNARNVVTRGFEPALEAAGLAANDPKITFHDLRHAFASMMIERGMTSIELADVMGHRDARVAEQTYIHLFNREKTERKIRAAMQSAMDL